jgi:hypothetical protein
MIHSYPYSFITQQRHSVTAVNAAKGHFVLKGKYEDGRGFTLNYYDETFEGEQLDAPVALVASPEMEVINAFKKALE